MRSGRIRLWIAGLVAFLMGFPFSEKLFAADSSLRFLDPSELS